MNKIPCTLIQDLLPIYVDGAVSEETACLVREHLDDCEECSKEYETMQRELELPSNPDLRSESAHAMKNMKLGLKWKTIAVAAISVLLTVVLGITAYMVYENVGVVNEFFNPRMYATVRDNDTEEWQPLWLQLDHAGLETTDSLNFNSLFYHREVVSDSNSDGPVTLRIWDKNEMVILDEVEIQPGASVSLEKLHWNTEYRVEIQLHAKTAFLKFI